MPVPVLRSISGATFRTNPHCDFVPLPSLSLRESRYVAGRTSEASAAGVLRRRDIARPVLTLIDATALRLLERLRQPGSPYGKHDVSEDLRDAELARLVLDGALEIETAAGFVSGPSAFEAVVERFEDCDGTAIARLSRRAVAHAAAFDEDGANVLSARLYCYGRRPASPRWRRALPRRDSVADFLQFRDGLPAGSGVRAIWHAKHPDRPVDGWFSWYRRNVPTNGAAWQGYKLYVSPSPNSVSETFATIVATLTDSEAISFKIGADVYGLLRPDKIVAYFATRAGLNCAAGALSRALHGVAAHGVPFSCSLDADGLLSWGCDPPAGSVSPERESWRLWITNRLADALLNAKAKRSDVPSPERFALARIALEGVDPESWFPLDVAWRRAPDTA